MFLINFHKIRFQSEKLKIDVDNIINELIEINKFLSPFSKPVWKLLNKLGKNNEIILFEGA